MSTIKVDTIQTSAGIEKFMSKCWIDYNPQTNTVNGSGGLSSVTDHGVGNHTFNFASSASSAYYSYGGCGLDSTLGDADDGVTTCALTKTASTARMISGYRNVEYDYDGFSYFFSLE